ncbi:uncharacterized protein LOC143228066 [Tachypleus tridentatus]|uniref:uncharacterized protein LOC143228066 n=1 Tax=Tachypleus tridentatus TaxID=6853 RepID=UPI003FD3B90C
MRTSWVFIGLLVSGSIVVAKTNEKNEAEETVVKSASESGILSTFVPDTQSSGYMIAYPLDEASEKIQEDEYVTAESLEGPSENGKHPKSELKEQVLGEANQDDDDEDNEKIDETLLLIVPEEKNEDKEDTEKVTAAEEGGVIVAGGVENIKAITYNIPQLPEESETENQTDIPEERRPKQEDLKKIRNFESPSHPFLKKAKPIPEDKPEPFRFPPAYPKSSRKQDRHSIPFPLKPESRSDQFFPLPVSQMAESILIRRALVLGNGIDKEEEEQPLKDKEDILAEESDEKAVEDKNPPKDLNDRLFSPVQIGSNGRPHIKINSNPDVSHSPFQSRPLEKPGNEMNLKPSISHPPFQPRPFIRLMNNRKPNPNFSRSTYQQRSFRSPVSRITSNPDFSRLQFYPRPIQRPDVELNPDPVFTRSQKHPIFVNTGLPVVPFSPLAPLTSHPQQTYFSVPYYGQHPYRRPALPPLQHTFVLLSYPQHSPLVNQFPKPHPAYMSHTRTYPSPAMLPVVQSAYEQPLDYKSLPISSIYYAPPSQTQPLDNGLIQDKSQDYEQSRYLGAPGPMGVMMKHHFFPAESQYFPVPLPGTGQPVQYSRYATTEDHSNQQIVPIFIPVPVPVPVERTPSLPDERQQLLYHEDPYSDGNHQRVKGQGIMLIYDESDKDPLRSRSMVAQDQTIVKPFPTEDALQKMKFLRKLILDKLIEKHENKEIPSEKSEAESEIIEVFVPFPTQ